MAGSYDIATLRYGACMFLAYGTRKRHVWAMRHIGQIDCLRVGEPNSKPAAIITS